jgi:predicted aspartyl protease
VPIESVNGLVCFQVAIGASPPVRALLDTGFSESVVDVDVARRLGLKVTSSRSEAAPGGAVDVGTLAPTSITIGALSVPDVALSTIAVAGMGPVIGRPLDAIVGHDVLERYVVEIDWRAGRLRFFDAAQYAHDGPGLVLGIEIRDRQPLLPAGIEMPGGRTVFGAFKMDTGSLDAAGLNLNFVREQALLPAGTAELSVGGIAVGGETQGRLFRARALWIGSRRVAAPLIGYTVDSKGFENRSDAGTIGVAVLSRFRIVLDYPRRRVIFEDVAAPEARAEEDQSGAFVTAAPPELRLVVVAQVLAGSPAAEAGLQVGDEIVAVAGRSLDLIEVRRELQKSGPVTLRLRRTGELREAILRRRPLLP